MNDRERKGVTLQFLEKRVHAMTLRAVFPCPARPFQVRAFPVDRLGVLSYDNTLTPITASKNPCVLSRHFRMPLAGIHSDIRHSGMTLDGIHTSTSLDSGQKRAGTTEDYTCR